jgi:AcrR family transcriptional regulator
MGGSVARPAVTRLRRRTTRAESKQLTHTRVLEAALKVFRNDGYHGASLDRVAGAAGYTKGAVYSAFDSKADLFLALLAQRAATRRDELRNLLDQSQTAADFVEEVTRRFAASVGLERDWWIAVIEFMTVVGRDERLRVRFAAHHNASRVLIAESIAEWARRHRSRPMMEARQLATLILALNNGLTLESLVAPEEVSTQAYVDGQLALTRLALERPRHPHS